MLRRAVAHAVLNLNMLRPVDRGNEVNVLRTQLPHSHRAQIAHCPADPQHRRSRREIDSSVSTVAQG
jgi:hypothetical protein